jgi:predicted nucleic acid-binding protein
MPDLEGKLFLLLGISGMHIVQNPPRNSAVALNKIINRKDSPILASAIEHSSYLLTLDNDFLKENVIAFTKQRGLTILKPEGFILLNN